LCHWPLWQADPNKPGVYPAAEQAERFKSLVFCAAANEEISLSKGAYLMDQPLVEFRDALQLVA
jgi:hypothetical protein